MESYMYRQYSRKEAAETSIRKGERGGSRRPARTGGRPLAWKRFVPALAVLLAGCGYNELSELDESAAAARNEIQVQLQARAELVPNLLEALRSHGIGDEQMLAAAANARIALVSAVNAEDIAGMQSANADLRDALDGLTTAATGHAALRSDAGLQLLSSQLEATKEQVELAGRAYNDAVRAYNEFIEGFPQLVTAKVIGAQKRDLFEPKGDPGATPPVDQ